MSPDLTPETLTKLADIAVRAQGIEITTITNVAGAPGLPDAIPVAIRRGAQPEVVSLAGLLDGWRIRPARKKGTAKAFTLLSFVNLTNRHKTAHSAIFADIDWRKPSLTAVIDYHEKGAEPVELPSLAVADAEESGDEAAGRFVEGLVETVIGTYAPAPDNMGHRIHYAYPISDAWKAWVEKDGETFGQHEFAAWIEDHIADLSSPEDAEKIWLERDFQTTVATPAGLITLSRGLSVHVEAKVKNTVTLQSGAGSIQFEESHVGDDGKPIVVPGIFLLSVSPFVDGKPVRVPVRLRYRVSAGRLVWWFQMHRPDIHITQAVKDDIATVATATGLPVYAGTPEA